MSRITPYPNRADQYKVNSKPNTTESSTSLSEQSLFAPLPNAANAAEEKKDRKAIKIRSLDSVEPAELPEDIKKLITKLQEGVETIRLNMAFEDELKKHKDKLTPGQHGET